MYLTLLCRFHSLRGIIHQYEIALDSDAMAASAQTLRESHSRPGYGSPSQ